MLLEAPKPVTWQRFNLDGSIESVRFDRRKVPYWSKVRGYAFVWCARAGMDPRDLWRLSGPSENSISIVSQFERVECNPLPTIGAAYFRKSKP